MAPKESEGLQVTPQHEGKIVQEPHGNYTHQGYSAEPRYASGAATFATSQSKHSNDEHQQRRTICGLGVATFWIVVTALVLALAAGIGGGVGGGLASRKKSNCPTSTSGSGAAAASTTLPASSTTTLTTAPLATATSLGDYEPPVSATSMKNLRSECPTRDAAKYVSLTDDHFTIHCNKDIPVTNQDINAENKEVGTYNLVSVRAYSLDDCMEACGAHNWYIGNSTDYCEAVVLNWNMADTIENYYGNCFLKTGKELIDYPSERGSGVAATMDY